MTDPCLDSSFEHTALGGNGGRPLEDLSLTDRERLTTVLQAAALMSHLWAAGRHLVSGWQELELDREGLLRGARVGQGRDPAPLQIRLIALLETLFAARTSIVGKGAARRSAARLLRYLHRSWNHLSADRVAATLLNENGFLWQSRYAPIRRSLVARTTEGSVSRILVAGSGRFERRVQALVYGGGSAEQIVTGQSARDLWKGRSESVGGTICGEGRLAQGRSLHRAGRWREAVEVLGALQAVEARILLADCHRLLGRTRTALRLLDDLTEHGKGSASLELMALETRVRLLLDRGEAEAAAAQLAQQEIAITPQRQSRLDLLAAEVAGHCHDWVRVDRYLPEREELGPETELAWRWDRLRLLLAGSRGCRESAEMSALAVFRSARRRMPRFEAADFWRRLASIRLAAGDTPAAERAATHAFRLVADLEESAASEIALWLADLRLRRGRCQGVEALLGSEDSWFSDSRRVGDPDPRGLHSRLDLVKGRPAAAVERWESFLETGGRSSSVQGRRLAILAARALGWLGRGSEAREILEAVGEAASLYLDAEEIPPLWALAGDWQRARESVPADPVGKLWRAALDGQPGSRDSWQSLDSLDRYRAARLVLDLQILMPGTAPSHWVERAAKILRAAGANSYAERLDRTKQGTWRILESFLSGSPREARDLGELFVEAGFFDARLVWCHRDSIRVLVAGRGGSTEMQAEMMGGQLVLSTHSTDPALRTLFALAVQQYEPDTREVDCRGVDRRNGILGESRSLKQALGRLERLAGSEVPVLIQGETGTGKELAARHLHRLSHRAEQRLVTVNCAALSESLLLADLFGHIRGAFTGAERDRAGVFESAGGGTVLLDEIGDLPWTAQGKLLRVLQEGEVRRVGESLPRRVDIRVVAATHRDLRSLVDKGKFRADLFYRLNVGTLVLPPLRSRGEDVLLLAEHFVQREGRGLSPRARQALLNHDWPGNVRELQNVVQVALALSDGAQIRSADLELPDVQSTPLDGYHRQVEQFRRQLVRDALAASAGQKTLAARRLNLSRQALSYLVRRFGLE